MKIIPSKYNNAGDLPLKLQISFEAIFEYLEQIVENKNHLLYETALKILEEYKAYPELRTGFEDPTKLEKYNHQIDKLLDILFPEMLQSNEIKAASIPFEFTTFKLSKRFEKLLQDAGEDYQLKLRNFDEDNMYILSCTFILGFWYNVNLDFRRPFYYDIPTSTGFIKNYKTLFNGDFFKVTPLENAPKLTEEDIHLLLDNFDNIDIWKEKFPPNSYQFRGFGMMNLVDATTDQSLTNLKENLLKKDQDTSNRISESIAKLYHSSTIEFGVSTFELVGDNFEFNKIIEKNSFINDQVKSQKNKLKNFFCKGITSKVFENKELLAISNVEKYGEQTNFNAFYKALKANNIQSIILVPLQLNNNLLSVLELVSSKKYELNSINAYKLKDVIPVFKIAIKRFMEEFDNKLESIIQENYTSIHPSVKWKFYEEAQKHLFSLEHHEKTYNLNSIVFKQVTPLYGQSDIKGSSTARNKAIQEDLIKQLKLASNIIDKAFNKYKLPIYSDLIYRIEECLINIKNGLNSGDENSLTDFLKKDIYPVFNHLKSLDKTLESDISNYMSLIDDNLHVIYYKRKMYDDSVNTLNETLASYIDSKQEEAQQMFPHYFERYKTDGIDHNMYIGQSLVKNRTYAPIYLNNLRLWQLQMMCEVEKIAHSLKNKLSHKLEIASLILVHSSPLAIKFRMDEKKFDVDGAYNIRFEIIKKRIDKIHIKNTNERLTQVGKIAIVYSQATDVREYMKHIKYLQSNNYLLETIEELDLENLQGISGLKALRVAVNYENSNPLNEVFKIINQEN
ncbi:GAF domain-containing protein [Lutibacter holmesii]|uniref:GAF domain-containing protein n=1 Tax=Lutibacter holmesii TaxID=1137985 RepID=A0ABW3WKZ0_9FLAO